MPAQNTATTIFYTSDKHSQALEPPVKAHVADGTDFAITETKELRNKGIKPIFDYFSYDIFRWYAPKEQIYVPYFLPLENKSKLSVCIPINTVDLDIDMEDQLGDDEISAYCPICRGKISWYAYTSGSFYDSECKCGLPDTMAVFDIKIENLRDQDGKYSFDIFYTLIKNICDKMKSTISSIEIPKNMRYSIEKILSFFRFHYDIEMIDDYKDD